MTTANQRRIMEALHTKAVIDPAQEVAFRVQFLQDYLLSSGRNGCSSRIKSRTQSHHFSRKRRYFGQNKVTDWHISHFCQKFLTKNKVADSNAVYLLQISKRNKS